ncbi:MAG: DUF2007 domain-containing protein [Gammaproteobacteria bacterium]
MLRLYQAADLQEAHLLLHQLSAEGIEARLFNQYAQGGLGDIPFPNAYPEIWLLDERDLARARMVIYSFERRPEVEGQITCPNCGEDNPANFETCWHCGASLDNATHKERPKS